MLPFPMLHLVSLSSNSTIVLIVVVAVVVVVVVVVVVPGLLQRPTERDFKVLCIAIARGLLCRGRHQKTKLCDVCDRKRICCSVMYF